MFLGVDQSVTGTGLCLMAPGRAGFQAHVISIPKIIEEQRAGARLQYIYSQAHEWVRARTRGDFDCIKMAAMEGYAYGQQGDHFGLGEVGGIIKLLFTQLGIPWVVVNPDHLKQWVKGTAGGPKEIIMVQLLYDFGVMFENIPEKQRNNAADAYALACVAMDYTGTWHEPASNVKMRDARKHVVQEIKLDPHAIYKKSVKDKKRKVQTQT